MCNECGKALTTKHALVIHQWTHVGEKSCECSECGKASSQTICLIQHERCHKWKTPFLGTECGKSCSHKYGLVMHQRIHTEMSYECSEYGKAFTTKSVHQITHIGERSYACSSCEKAFFHLSNLVKCKKKHTREMGRFSKVENSFNRESRLII